jgi:DNA repair photolyase
MNQKPFKGKAIYNPSGKAGEYSAWACNFYTGCSNMCNYCYCRRGVMSHVWSETPKLKSCFRHELDAINIFEKEVKQNLDQLQKYGLFFSFTTDPMLSETIYLTIQACCFCMQNSIPVSILTKVDFKSIELYTDGLSCLFPEIVPEEYKHLLSFGFTLTGCDEEEPHASSNEERISCMKKLHEMGYKTWSSIEPVINISKSMDMIRQSSEYCLLYKVGLLSGKKYPKAELVQFINEVTTSYPNNLFYFKESIIQQAGIAREDLPRNCVDRYYNMFNSK